MRLIKVKFWEFCLGSITVWTNLLNIYIYSNRSELFESSSLNFFILFSQLRSICSVSWIDVSIDFDDHLIIRIHPLAFNTLTANYEYSRNNTDDLPLPVQMQLSGKLKTFSGFFIVFLESTLNFEHFEKKKISLTAQVFLKLYTPKDVFT